MKRKRGVEILSLLFLVLMSCNKDNHWKPIEPSVYLNYKDVNGVFVCNEGNFMYGNASLSFYNANTHQCDNDIFYHTNGFPLGDVCQSMTIWNGLGYIVMNNSGKVFVVNIDDMTYTGAIRGLVSPRYVKILSPQKGYVSDLYAPFITIFHPTTFKTLGTISLGTNGSFGRVNGSEMMVLWNNYLFTNSWSYNNKVYKIDTRTDRVIDSLSVGNQPNSLVIDKKGKLWILSAGGYEGSPLGHEFAELTRIDAEQFVIEKTYQFDELSASPSELTVNTTSDTLYFINSKTTTTTALRKAGIFAMSIESQTLPDQPFIQNADRLIYGLGIDPKTGDIYISDAIDYVQQGTIYRYSSQGKLLTQFKTGIIPGAFCFKP